MSHSWSCGTHPEDSRRASPAGRKRVPRVGGASLGLLCLGDGAPSNMCSWSWKDGKASCAWTHTKTNEAKSCMLLQQRRRGNGCKLWLGRGCKVEHDVLPANALYRKFVLVPPVGLTQQQSQWQYLFVPHFLQAGLFQSANLSTYFTTCSLNLLRRSLHKRYWFHSTDLSTCSNTSSLNNIDSLRRRRMHRYYCRPHNLGASFWEYISKCCESDVSMSDAYLFLVRAWQINYFVLGVQSFKTMDTVSQGIIYYY